jgi:tetratricopeptide (TPR) repeat protein
VRFSIYGGTLAMARDFPLFGAGLGTFADVFPKYRTDPFTDKVADMAHSDWLQLLGEIGVIGFLFIFVGAVFYFLYLWKNLQKRQDPFAVGITLGCLGALCSVGFHAMVDFPLHIPANAMLMGVVLALAFLAVHLHRQPREHFSYAIRQLRCRRPLALVLLGSLAGVVVILALPVWNHWAAESLVPSEQDFTQDRPSFAASDIKQAMAYSPNNPVYPALLAGELHKPPPKSEAGASEEAMETETIFDLYRQAIRLNPAQWRYRLEYAWALIGSGNPENLAGFRQGLQELETCTKLFPASGMVHFSYGSALLLAENAIPDLLPPEKKGLGEQEIEQGIMQDPDLAEAAEKFFEKITNP